MALPRMSAMNAWFAGYAATVPAMAGSWLTFLYYGAALWAAFNATYRRYTLELPIRSLPFVLSGLALSALLLLSSLMNGIEKGLFGSIDSLLTLVAAPLLIGRFRYAGPEKAWQMFKQHAPLGALAGVLTVFLAGSSSGGAGNDNVFAAAMGVLAIFSLASAISSGGWSRLLGVAGFAFAATGILISGYRTLYPAVVLLPMLALALGGFLRSTYIAGGIAMILLVAAVNHQSLERQWLFLNYEIDSVQDRTETALTARLDLWSASIHAIIQKPILGYGMLRKMEVVNDTLSKRTQSTFSHVHNAFLDVTVSGGVLALGAFTLLLLSPLWMVFGRPDEPADRRFSVIAMVLLFGMIGMTSVFLVHDLLIVLFVLPLVIAAACDPDSRTYVLLQGRSRDREASRDETSGRSDGSPDRSGDQRPHVSVVVSLLVTAIAATFVWGLYRNEALVEPWLRIW